MISSDALEAAYYHRNFHRVGCCKEALKNMLFVARACISWTYDLRSNASVSAVTRFRALSLHISIH